MSQCFHIKKKSIIISIVLVKFLAIVRWTYKIPSERCHRYEHNAPARAWHAIRCGNCSLAKISLNLHIQRLEDQFALASIFPLRWVVCCVLTDCGFYSSGFFSGFFLKILPFCECNVVRIKSEYPKRDITGTLRWRCCLPIYLLQL